MNAPLLTDAYNRRISYVRVSVTDRCDLRCTYCMTERMAFSPKPEVLTLEELDRLCSVFVRGGVTKLRITGGEPLVRRDIVHLLERLSRHLKSGALGELALTSNGTRLAAHAHDLARLGIRRVNVSLDTLDRAMFERITRRDQLAAVLEGIDAAQQAGLAIKLNTVALKGLNLEEIPSIIQWAHARGIDVSLIEAMPLGEMEANRGDQYVSLQDVRSTLESFWRLDETSINTGGPSRYVRVRDTGGLVGFITPISHNFCETCNRVRLTCTGRLYLCLGQDDHIDFRTALRAGATDPDLIDMFKAALEIKPRAHEFEVNTPAPQRRPRHMSVTGG